MLSQQKEQKQVQIDYKTFIDCLRILYCEDFSNEELIRETGQALYNKLDKMIARNIYKKYKTAPTAEEREKARKEYLEHIGAPADYRW